MDNNHKTSKSPEKLSYAIYRPEINHAVDSGFQIFVSETWISHSKAGILDFTSKIFQDSGIRIPLHEARDYCQPITAKCTIILPLFQMN